MSRREPEGSRPPADRSEDAAVRQVRGSTLLLSGRAISLVLNGVAQVILARSLTRAEYGAFAYGLSVLLFADLFTTLGLNRAITRFVPVYEERGEYGKVVGTVVFVFGVIVSLGLTVIIAVRVFQGSIEQLLIHDRRTVAVLAILIVITPIEAAERMNEGILAVLDRPGAIFFRRHILGPSLRVLVIVLLTARGASVPAVAWGYVLVGAVGLALYATLMVRAVREHGFPVPQRWKEIQIPYRELSEFVVPLLTAGIISVALQTSDAFFLGRFGGATDVAQLRAVQPLARIAQAPLVSFSTLFGAAAARLFARGDVKGANDLYWRTAAWIGLFSFPIFVMSFAFARPMTTTIFGAKYAGSTDVLFAISIGYFIHASLGMNEQVLTAFGQLRFVLVSNASVLVANLGLMFWLVPWLGPLGAAIGRTTSLVLINIIAQVGLRAKVGVRSFDARYARTFLAMALAATALLLVGRLVPPLYLCVLLTGLAWLLLLAVSRKSLRIAHVFPEIRRIPLARFLAGEPSDE